MVVLAVGGIEKKRKSTGYWLYVGNLSHQSLSNVCIFDCSHCALVCIVL